MQILAGSLNVEVREFLHAGYISAYPRTFSTVGLYAHYEAKGKVIVVTEALELKPAGAPPTATPSETAVETPAAVTPLPPASMATDGFQLTVLFFFFAFLFSLYYRRLRKIPRPGWRPWVFAGVPLLAVVGVVQWVVPAYTEYRANHLPPPWEEAELDGAKWPSAETASRTAALAAAVPGRREYRDPQAATEAILQTLIIPALAGCGFRVEHLAAIQEEVAFPIPIEAHTPGMAYAVRTYGLDGWGRPFTFQWLPNQPDRDYRVASAGADGVLGSADDVVWQSQSPRGDWEPRVNGMFVRAVQGDRQCFIHRVRDHHFRFAHAQEARAATSTGLFDMFPFKELAGSAETEQSRSPILAALKPHLAADAAPAGGEPLLFLQFVPAHDG
jgi:hypothetical protein